MSEANLAVVRRYFDCINSRDWEGVAEVTVPGLSAVVRDHLWVAHPDLRIDIEWIEAHTDKVTAWCVGHGTHEKAWTLPPSMGNLAGLTLPPTGRSWQAACSTSYQIIDGKISEVWAVWDWLQLLSQLGVVTVSPRKR